MQATVAGTSPLSICLDATDAWDRCVSLLIGSQANMCLLTVFSLCSYTGGVMTASECGKLLNHCVQIVGYNTTASTPYWIVRNSVRCAPYDMWHANRHSISQPLTTHCVVCRARSQWSTSWGDNGFIYLEMGKDTCGLSFNPTYAQQ